MKTKILLLAGLAFACVACSNGGAALDSQSLALDAGAGDAAAAPAVAFAAASTSPVLTPAPPDASTPCLGGKWCDGQCTNFAWWNGCNAGTCEACPVPTFEHAYPGCSARRCTVFCEYGFRLSDTGDACEPIPQTDAGKI